ncbi:MAG: hypothetical protein LBD91_04900 [Prevotellaceae bacterium]|jgi:hypothetical protein|nr:hypothetical protein [Prevotellaceae bacterium]
MKKLILLSVLALSVSTAWRQGGTGDTPIKINLSESRLTACAGSEITLVAAAQQLLLQSDKYWRQPARKRVGHIRLRYNYRHRQRLYDMVSTTNVINAHKKQREASSPDASQTCSMVFAIAKTINRKKWQIIKSQIRQDGRL